MGEHRLVALIPARAGSVRIPGKNVRLLNGAPLLAYAIAAAHESDIFERIVVSSDSMEALEIAEQYGAEPIRRPQAMAEAWSPDIQWIQHALTICQEWNYGPPLSHSSEAHTRHQVAEPNNEYDAFVILRPTSPFRRGTWVRAAWETFLDQQPVDSLRAMRPCSEHPGKMWRPIWDHGRLVVPLLPFRLEQSPWHSSPSQELPAVYTQTAALEIAWTRVLKTEMISGETVTPYMTTADAPESCDLNTPQDWLRADALATAHPEWLPVPRGVEVQHPGGAVVNPYELMVKPLLREMRA